MLVIEFYEKERKCPLITLQYNSSKHFKKVKLFKIVFVLSRTEMIFETTVKIFPVFSTTRHMYVAKHFHPLL